MTEKPDGNCSSRMFYQPFSGVCYNGLSDHRGDFMPPTETCDEYTVIEEEEET